MFLRIETIKPKQLTGMGISMSLAANKTAALWQGFMQRRKEISNVHGTELYSIEVYDRTYFENFSPHAVFEKYAAVEVSHTGSVPPEMQSITIPGGLYAVFLHKGTAADGPVTFRYIFETWLPASIYRLDNRPHFEVMGEKYRNNDPGSEEELWVPIRVK